QWMFRSLDMDLYEADDQPSCEASDPTQTEDPPSKKLKLETLQAGDDGGTETLTANAEPKVQSEICVACLGVLQDFCDQSYTTQVIIEVLFIFPKLHQSYILLLDNFMLITPGVKIQSGFEVSVGFTHAETDGDCHFLYVATTCSDCFKPTKNKASVFTRMAVVKALEKISDQKFLSNYPCPPVHPATRCTPLDTTLLHASVFIAGRYNKFSRELPQTPWVIDGERRMEGSVEELIAGPLLSSFRADGFNFSSSGREDVDVRTLGNGRPFAMELLNPHRARFNKAEIRQLQETINTSSDKIRVRDLQIVTREAMGRMKEGEEEKTKTYSALIWTKKPITHTDLDFIKNIKELKVDQKTPLRVLHRRPLAVRQRVIHSMSASFLDTHHFKLQLHTQAGTYIKEFVHGDFGRTKPNLCALMDSEVDILELDVESVDVDWPPAVPE
uniref:tRNA pseudouridine(55) synthase n=1 Tax=Astyanax mexicanus TaxID=7994 RepID=A0A8B9K186_ASTMX